MCSWWITHTDNWFGASKHLILKRGCCGNFQSVVGCSEVQITAWADAAFEVESSLGSRNPIVKSDVVSRIELNSLLPSCGPIINCFLVYFRTIPDGARAYS